MEFLEAFADAWNRHDVDDLMSFMTDDGLFESSAVEDSCGTRFEGPDAVSKSYARVWGDFPDARWNILAILCRGIKVFPSGHSQAQTV